MSEQHRLDFLAAFGDEFCDALADSVGQGVLVPQDALEVFLRVFHEEPSLQLLSSLSDVQLEQLRVGSVSYFETDGIAIEQIRLAVTRTLARYPVR